MNITYEFTITAYCPIADDIVDVYSATLVTDTRINVETILEHTRAYSSIATYQEEMTADLAEKLGGTLTTVGYHSGVRTTVTADAVPVRQSAVED